MPGIPLVARETTYSRSADQMCRQDSRVHLSAEEEIAAEESLSIYCKPVELYNILQRRANRNPLFLQRCLNYKIQAKHKKRIQMTISLSVTVNDGCQDQSLFPLYILLARPVSNVPVAENSAVYHFNRACTLTSCNGFEGMNRAQAKFILPEINKLSVEVKSGSLALLLVSCDEITNSSCGIDLTQGHMDNSFPSNVGGHCLLGKIPMELLFLSWERSPNLSLGERAEMLSTVDMHSCFVKEKPYLQTISSMSRMNEIEKCLWILVWDLFTFFFFPPLFCYYCLDFLLQSSFLDEGKCISFQVPYNSCTLSTPKQLQVIISGEEVGAKERSPYNLYSYNEIPTSSLSHIIRLRTGNVIFNYRYYDNKLQRTEDQFGGRQFLSKHMCQ
ncbi:unnamed protein product [Ilex paraguariensis]|uniref:DUF7651 domain-containing protein n=1 Tax=Ilex paraguariensis TaxID=185542 RepID=A0ABC8QS94_9AQUA